MARTRKPPSNTYGAQSRREAQRPTTTLVVQVVREAPASYRIDAESSNGQSLRDYRRTARGAGQRAEKLAGLLR